MKELIINTLIWMFIIVTMFSLIISIVVCVFIYPEYSFYIFVVVGILIMAFNIGKDNPIYKSKKEEL